MSDVGRVKGSQERGGEAPPKDGAKTITVRKGETARQLYDRMYPETPLPDKGLRYFIAYFLETRKDVPSPGDSFEVPAHEKLFKIGTHANPEAIALATKLAGEKGDLTHLSEIRQAVSKQSKGLEQQATALAPPKPQQKRKPGTARQALKVAARHSDLSDIAPSDAVQKKPSSPAQVALVGLAQRALARPGAQQSPEAFVKALLDDPAVARVTVDAFRDAGQNQGALRMRLYGILAENRVRDATALAKAAARALVDRYVPAKDKRPEIHVPEQLANALRAIPTPESLGKTIRDDVIAMARDQVLSILTGKLADNFGEAMEAVRETVVETLLAVGVHAEVAEALGAEVARDICGARQDQTREATPERLAEIRTALRDRAGDLLAAKDTASLSTRLAPLLYGSRQRAGEVDLPLNWLGEVSSAQVQEMVRDILTGAPHRFPDAQAQEQAKAVLTELADAAGTVFLVKVARAAERNIQEASQHIREVLAQPAELDPFVAAVQAGPQRVALRNTLGLSEDGAVDRAQVREGLERLLGRYENLLRHIRGGAVQGYDKYLDELAWAAPQVALAYHVRLDGGEVSAKSPSLLETGISAKRSFSATMRRVASVAAATSSIGSGFGEGAAAVLANVLLNTAALTPKWVAQAVQD